MVTKKTTTKRTSVKRAPAKTTAKTTVKRVEADPGMKSFKRTTIKPFVRFKITDQTFYWLLLGSIWLLIGIWIADVCLKVFGIYDDLEAARNAGVLLSL